MGLAALRKPGTLFGFEVTPGHAADVGNVPKAVDFGRVRCGRHIEIGDVDAIQRDTGCIPGVNVTAKAAGLPAEAARAIEGKRSCDG